MARRIIHQLIDDLTGKQADESVNFGIDGANYEIDLSADNAAALRGVLSPYAAAGQKVGKTPKPIPRQTTGYRRIELDPVPDPKAMRTWAKAQGLRVNDRGRVHGKIEAAYNGRHGDNAAQLLADAREIVGNVANVVGNNGGNTQPADTAEASVTPTPAPSAQPAAAKPPRQRAANNVANKTAPLARKTAPPARKTAPRKTTR